MTEDLDGVGKHGDTHQEDMGEGGTHLLFSRYVI